jgi:GNAT superfamily N-acetyltransferase
LFADRDYNAYSRIHSMTIGTRVTPEDARASDAQWDYSRFERVRLVAVDEEDVPTGYGEIFHEPSRYDPRRYFMHLGVDPRLRRRGIGAALWEHLRAELDERGARFANIWADDATPCQDFILARGFTEVVRTYHQVLSMAKAALPTPASRERIAAHGVRIASLSTLALVDGDALTKAHRLDTESRIGQPTLGTVTPSPFEMWKRYNLEDPLALPDAYFIASIDGTFVGQCTARRRPNSEDALQIGITGVLPAFRGRGIARALKLELHGYAKAHGFREIHTNTAKQNGAMVGLNTSLGYAIVESWGGYELAIPTSP